MKQSLFSPRTGLGVFILLWCAVVVPAQNRVQGAKSQSPAPLQAPDTPAPREQALTQLNLSDPELVRFLFSKLELTDEQRHRILALRREHSTQLAQLNREMRLRRQALDAAMYSEDFNEALVEQRTAELAEAQTARLKVEMKVQAAIRQVLTREQVRQFNELRQLAAEMQLLQQRRQNQNRQNRPQNQPD